MGKRLSKSELEAQAWLADNPDFDEQNPVDVDPDGQHEIRTGVHVGTVRAAGQPSRAYDNIEAAIEVMDTLNAPLSAAQMATAETVYLENFDPGQSEAAA